MSVHAVVICKEMIDLVDVIQAAPDPVTDGFYLLRELKDPHTEEDLLLFADGERVGVDPSTVYALQCILHLRQVVEGAFVS